MPEVVLLGCSTNAWSRTLLANTSLRKPTDLTMAAVGASTKQSLRWGAGSAGRSWTRFSTGLISGSAANQKLEAYAPGEHNS